MPLNIDFQQVLLHMLNVAILFGILYFLLYNPIKKFMDDRKAEYEEKEKQTNEALAAALKNQEESEKKLADLDAELEKKRLIAEREAEDAADVIKDEARAEAEKILERSRRVSEIERKRMIEQLKEELADMVTDTVGDTAYQNTSSAYDGFLDAIERSGNNAKS